MPAYNELDLGGQRGRRRPGFSGAVQTQPLPNPTTRVDVPGIDVGEPNPNTPAPTAPGYGQGAGKLEGFGGFNADGTPKFGSDHVNKSPKYAFADVFQNYANTPEGFQSGFAELQKKYPQFFSNWQIDGDDSIKWTGQGSLASEFNGETAFDVWRNASGEGGSTAWWWGPGPNAAGNTNTNQSSLDAMLAALQPNPGMVMNLPDLSAMFQQMNPPTSTINVQMPQPSAMENIVPPVSQNPTPMPLMDGQSESVNQAISMIAQAMPELMMRRRPVSDDPLMAAIGRLLGVA